MQAAVRGKEILMRLDKFLKNSRIIKRRTVAKEACEQGRVEVNGKPAKPGTELKVGDIIKVTFGSSVLEVRVAMLSESVRKEDSGSMYEVI
jgi:ribosomal 50S subunit-recycling heat shock protein